MDISNTRPLELGWQRMKRTLLRPFDLGRWMVLGFTAWLAALMDSGAGGDAGSEGFRITRQLDDGNWRDSLQDMWDGFGGFVGGSVGLAVVTVAVIAAVFVWLLLLWVSSRGRFMFQDNLIHGRTEVTAPWREFRAEGDSLFVWLAGYTIIAGIIVAAIALGFVATLVPIAAWDAPIALGLPLAIVLGVVAFGVIVAMAYVDYFVEQFIVPLMHRHRIGARAAWGRFLPLFRAHPGAFALFGLFYLAIAAAMGIAYLLAGVLTCCLGLLLLALPYLGAVATLPATVFGRFMNLEFLAQFGGDFDLLPPLDEPAAPPPAGSTEVDADRAVVRPEDTGVDGRTDEPGPQDT